ncbi:hypothetical protein N7535_008815 [Penicillium sp. DV-2018c]|nr:hypothetical protein N7535_008815 [Penicillium sp. DV-2018c]
MLLLFAPLPVTTSLFNLTQVLLEKTKHRQSISRSSSQACMVAEAEDMWRSSKEKVLWNMIPRRDRTRETATHRKPRGRFLIADVENGAIQSHALRLVYGDAVCEIQREVRAAAIMPITLEPARNGKDWE